MDKVIIPDSLADIFGTKFLRNLRVVKLIRCDDDGIHYITDDKGYVANITCVTAQYVHWYTTVLGEVVKGKISVSFIRSSISNHNQ